MRGRACLEVVLCAIQDAAISLNRCNNMRPLSMLNGVDCVPIMLQSCPVVEIEAGSDAITMAPTTDYDYSISSWCEKKRVEADSASSLHDILRRNVIHITHHHPHFN